MLKSDFTGFCRITGFAGESVRRRPLFLMLFSLSFSKHFDLLELSVPYPFHILTGNLQYIALHVAMHPLSSRAEKIIEYERGLLGGLVGKGLYQLKIACFSFCSWAAGWIWETISPQPNQVGLSTNRQKWAAFTLRRIGSSVDGWPRRAGSHH